jgi:hypothetical protein
VFADAVPAANDAASTAIIASTKNLTFLRIMRNVLSVYEQSGDCGAELRPARGPCGDERSPRSMGT